MACGGEGPAAPAPPAAQAACDLPCQSRLCCSTSANFMLNRHHNFCKRTYDRQCGMQNEHACSSKGRAAELEGSC